MINNYADTDPYHSDNVEMMDQNNNDNDDSNNQGSLSNSGEDSIVEDPLAGLGQYRDIIEEYADEEEPYADSANNQCEQRSLKKKSDLLLGRDDPASSAWGWKPVEIKTRDDDRAPTKNRGKLFLMWFLMGVVFLVFATTLVVVLVKNNNERNQNDVQPQEQEQQEQEQEQRQKQGLLDNNFLLDELTPISGREDLLNNTVRKAAMSWVRANYGPTMDDASIVETYAVVLLWFSTHGGQWTSQNNFLNSNVSICDWHIGTSKGIYCDENRKVEKVSLQRCNLQGTIPHELSVLDEMKYFYAYNNKLIGTIPPEIIDYHSLAMVHFAVDNNQLTGIIPRTFFRLKNLEILSVEHNQLGGIIWTEFGELAKLMQLRLADNKIRGTIPTELGNIYALRELIISNNQFQGTFPTEIGKCVQLSRVELSNNNFATNLDPIFCNHTITNTVSSVFPENLVVVVEDSCNPPHRVTCSCCCCANCTE